MNVNNFGMFNSDVWGTVSDWVMVGVTGLTAFFLWRTLRSQLKVQEAQNELTRIEQFWHRDKLQPKFEMNAETVKDSTDGTHNKIDIRFVTSIAGKDAYRVRFVVLEKDNWKFTINLEEQSVIKAGEPYTFRGVYENVKAEKFGNIFITSLNFFIYYSDADNNNYKMHILYTHFDGHNSCSNGIPKLLIN